MTDRDRYRPVSYGDVSAPNVASCKDCGVLVTDQAIHDRFHALNPERLPDACSPHGLPLQRGYWFPPKHEDDSWCLHISEWT